MQFCQLKKKIFLKSSKISEAIKEMYLKKKYKNMQEFCRKAQPSPKTTPYTM